MSKIRLKAEAYARQDGYCWHCDLQLPYIPSQIASGDFDGSLIDTHRIVPGAEDGEYTDENTVAIHPWCGQEVHGNVIDRAPSIENVKRLMDAYKTWQKARVAFNNSLDAAEKRGMDKLPAGTIELMQFQLDQIEAIEKTYKRRVEKMVMRLDTPLVDLITSQKGIGPIIAAGMLSYVQIEKARTISALWAYIGVHGPSKDRHVRGVKGGGNQFLRSLLYMASTGFLKQANEFYEPIYRKRRAKTDNSDREVPHRKRSETKFTDTAWKDVNKGRRYNDGLRMMLKQWLADLWLFWREIEGLPVRDPYIVALAKKEGHDFHAFSPPADRGWDIEEVMEAYKERMVKVSRLEKRERANGK